MSVGTASRSGSADLVIVTFRVMLGLLFLSQWGANLHAGRYDPGEYAEVIRGYVADGDAPGFWKELMEHVADGASITARLQLAAELAFGVLLVLGLATRLAGAAAGVYLSALWVSEIGVPSEWVWSIVFPALAAFAVALCAAGRTLGLDGVLGERLPRWAG